MKNQGLEVEMTAGRNFMKSNFTGPHPSSQSDQEKGLPQPPLTKPAITDNCIALPRVLEDVVQQPKYLELLRNRRSQRHFEDKPITIAQLSLMLGSTQGIEKTIGRNSLATLRPVPSGGARHPYETYIAVRKGEGMLPGLYHYLPQEHSMEFLRALPDYHDTLTEVFVGQSWVGHAAATLFWACDAYRAEWRYTDRAHRVMLMDVGHIAQNAALSAVAMGLGACCVAAYDQVLADEFLGIDGTDEFLVYALPFGYAAEKEKE